MKSTYSAPQHWRYFCIGLLLLGAFWISISRAPANSATAGKIPAPQAGFLAPDFALEDAEGNLTRLSDLRGQPVLLNYWATWCPPCRAEMPAMQTVYQEYQSQGLVILAVNATQQDSRSAALAFAAELDLSFPILFDKQGLVGEAYQIRSMPTSFFIHPDGTIQEVVIGGPMAEALLRSRVEQLLQGQEK